MFYKAGLGIVLSGCAVLGAAEGDAKKNALFTTKEQTAQVSYRKDDLGMGSAKNVLLSLYTLMEHKETNALYYGIESCIGGVWSTYALDYLSDTTIKRFGLGASVGVKGGYSWSLFEKLSITPYLKLSAGAFAPEAQFMNYFINPYSSAIGLKASYDLTDSFSTGIDMSVSRILGVYSKLSYQESGWAGTGKAKFSYYAALPITYAPKAWERVKFFIEPRYAGAHIAQKGSFEFGVGTTYCY